MKAKLILFSTVATFALSANAGLRDVLSAITGASQMVRDEEQAAIIRSLMPEVPLRADCDPAFSPGGDGIFRRTGYCHRSNPLEAQGFLRPGFDVPAGFLKGFTQEDVLDRWREAHYQLPEFLSSKAEVPTEIMLLLNTDAAQAWEGLLSCGSADADRAREMYRTGDFQGCKEEPFIRSKIADIRASLPRLASTIMLSPFLDGHRLEELQKELQAQREKKLAALGPAGATLLRWQRSVFSGTEIKELQAKGLYLELLEVLKDYIPRTPRFHPLLVQILFEELLGLFGPDDHPRAIAERLNHDVNQKTFLLQLLLWGHGIEDRGCSSAGLWPSANRVAVTAFFDRVAEIHQLKDGRFGTSSRYVFGVDCPKDLESHFEFEKDESVARSAPDYRKMMRLSDVYLVGRLNTWRELREVRERHSRARNP